MSVYLDASILVPLFVDDHHTNRAEAFLKSASTMIVVSNFAKAEFASALGRRVRMSELASSEALAAFVLADDWTRRDAELVDVETSDLHRTELILRQLRLPLRTPDAIHIAVAQRLGARLATFDRRMAECAQVLGLATVDC